MSEEREESKSYSNNLSDDARKNESQLEFLRSEHSVILHGLHSEIAKLQTKCKDLQFQLILNGIGPFLSSEEDELKDKTDRLESELKEKNLTCEDLRAKLKEKSETVERLEEEAKQREERYHEDVSARNLIVAKLRKEVQEKANTISNLVKLLRTRQNENGSSNLNREEILRKAEGEVHPYRTIGAASTRVALTVFSPHHQQKEDEGTLSSKGSTSASSYLDLGKKLVEKYCNSRGSVSEHLVVNGNVASTSSSSASVESPLQMSQESGGIITETCNRRKRPDTLSIGTINPHGQCYHRHHHHHFHHLHRLQSSRTKKQTDENEQEPKSQLQSIVSPSLKH